MAVSRGTGNHIEMALISDVPYLHPHLPLTPLPFRTHKRTSYGRRNRRARGVHHPSSCQPAAAYTEACAAHPLWRRQPPRRSRGMYARPMDMPSSSSPSQDSSSILSSLTVMGKSFALVRVCIPCPPLVAKPIQSDIRVSNISPLAGRSG